MDTVKLLNSRMIKSFGDNVTSDLFYGIALRGTIKHQNQEDPVPNSLSATYKLDMLNAVTSLDDLRSPPGNKLEALWGDYKGFHSIRINVQWTIVFRWQDSNAYDVTIVYYH